MTEKKRTKNHSGSTVVEYDGVSKTIKEWAADVGVTPDLIGDRLDGGWSVGEALTQPYTLRPREITASSTLPAKIQLNDVITFRGIRRSVMEWAVALNLGPKVLQKRLRMGTLSDALRKKGSRWVNRPTTPVDAAPEPAPVPVSPHRFPRDASGKLSVYQILSYRGETKTVLEWGVQLGINANTLAQRVASGWSAERVITTPLQNTNKVKGKQPVKFAPEAKALQSLIAPSMPSTPPLPAPPVAGKLSHIVQEGALAGMIAKLSFGAPPAPPELPLTQVGLAIRALVRACGFTTTDVQGVGFLVHTA